MNLTDRCQLALAEIARRRAVIAAATDAPWTFNPQSSGVSNMFSHGAQLFRGQFIATNEAHFIAASRNERDDELAALKTAIESLAYIVEHCVTWGRATADLNALLDTLGIPL